MPYSISIDAIDLKYLPITNYSQKKNKMKLFDISSAKRHDYLEFEIFASEANDETNTGTILPVCTTICQICNITIPACYITEHNQSNRHKMYKSIMDNALERVKKYLNEDNSVSDTKKLHDAYFCDVCCLAVLESEKEIHEQSQSHCKALKKEKQLKDLLHLYSVSLCAAENEGLFDIDDFDCFTAAFDEDIGKPESKFVFEFNDSEVKKEENVIKSIVEPEVYVKLSRSGKQRAKAQLNSKVNSKSKEDDDAADAKVPTDVEPIIPEEILEQPTIKVSDGVIEIMFSDGTVVNVIEYQYHGFINSDNITICLPCNELVKNTVAHKTTSEKHLRFMKVPIKDTNCIRQIADNFNHCIICNEIFADVNAHLDSNGHHSKKRRAIGEDPLDTDSIFKNTSNSKNYETERQIEKYFPNYYHLEVSENILNCKVCKVPVLNCLDVARQHVANKYHVEKYEEKLEAVGVTKSDDFSFSCQCCNIDGISKGTEIYHVFSSSHILKFILIELLKFRQDNFERPKLEPLSADKPKDVAAKTNPKLSAHELPDGIYSTSVQATVNCIICEVNLPNTLHNIDEHIQSAKHKTKYNGFLKHNQIDKLIDEVECRVCKVSLNDKEITEHVKNRNHKCNLEMSKHEAKEWITETKNEKIVLCQICTACINNQIDCIYEHVNGKDHNTNWSSYLKRNELIKNDENYFCEACNISVIPSLKEHSQSLSHKEMIANKQLKYVKYNGFMKHNQIDKLIDEVECRVCKVSLNDKEITEHVKNRNHKCNLEMSKHEAKEWIAETKNEKIVLCQICTACINNQIDCIYEHVNGKDHNTNWSSYLKRNELIKIDENYFCDACNISVIPSLKEHSQSLSHKEMIANKQLKYVDDKDVIRRFCSICGIHINNREVNLEEHKNGKFHRTNLKIKMIP